MVERGKPYQFLDLFLQVLPGLCVRVLFSCVFIGPKLKNRNCFLQNLIPKDEPNKGTNMFHCSSVLKSPVCYRCYRPAHGRLEVILPYIVNLSIIYDCLFVILLFLLTPETVIIYYSCIDVY